MMNPETNYQLAALLAGFAALDKAMFAPAPEPHTGVCCARCGSKRLRYEPYDNGEDVHTGYVDAGEMATCLDCGARCDERDLDPALDEESQS